MRLSEAAKSAAGVLKLRGAMAEINVVILFLLFFVYHM